MHFLAYAVGNFSFSARVRIIFQLNFWYSRCMWEWHTDYQRTTLVFFRKGKNCAIMHMSYLAVRMTTLYKFCVHARAVAVFSPEINWISVLLRDKCHFRVRRNARGRSSPSRRPEWPYEGVLWRSCYTA